MNLLKEKQYQLDCFILIVIGIFSLLYSVFFVNFAEVHIQLPFLNFPIFVGEFLLAFCFIALLIKWKITKQRFTLGHYLLFAYVTFFIFKAMYGYIKWGPLALRHSALFYYPLFAVIGYYFYNPKMFRPVIKIFLAYVFLLMIWQHRFHDYFLITYIALALLLILEFDKMWHRYIFLALLLIVIPYSKFFQPNRSFIVGFFSSLFFLYGCGVLFIPLRLKTKILLFVLFPTILFSWFFVQSLYLKPLSTAQRHSLKSLVNFGDLIREFKYYDFIVAAEEENFSMADIKPQLYKKTGRGLPEETFDNVSVLESEKAEPKVEILENPPPEETILAFLPTESEKKSEIFESFERIQVATKETKRVFKVTTDESEEELHNEPSSLMGSKEKKLPNEPSSLMSSKEEKIYVRNFVKLPAEYPLDKLPLGTTFYQVGNDRILLPLDWDPGYIKIKQVNTLFRLFMWRDLLEGLFENKPVLGFDFGKPFRSPSLEILEWSKSEWSHDGWIEPHNSYLHVLYRSGIVGLVILASLVAFFFSMFKEFIKKRSLTGIILMSVCVYWLVIANFLVLFELPYCSIPFWSLFGMTLAYGKGLKSKSISN